MDSISRTSAAEALLEANRSGVSIPPLRETYPDLTIEDAYEIQMLTVRSWLAEGRTVGGYKVGLTSPAMQKQLGVAQPDFGHIFTDQFYLENMPMDLSGHILPRVEPEIAFVLKEDLQGPGVTVVDAIRAIDYVLPALEVVDSRVRDWDIRIGDTVADNASGGGVVLGSTPSYLGDLDLRLVGCTMHKNGKVAGTGAGGAVLGSPINALVWLANTVGPLGTTLEAGKVVLPGSVTKMVPVGPGDRVTATFGGLGSVTALIANTSKEN